MSKRKLIIDLLKRMPRVISLNDMRAMGINHAPQIAKRLAEDGILERAGYGCYLNLLGKGEEREVTVWDVIVKIIPAPVVTGPSVLHAAGVITQRPAYIHIASCGRRTAPHIDGVIVEPLPRSWVRRHAEHMVLPSHPESMFCIPHLAPRAALDDMIRRDRMYGLNEDDIDPYYLEWPPGAETGAGRDM